MELLSRKNEIKNIRTLIKTILFLLQIVCFVWLIMFYIYYFTNFDISQKISSLSIIDWSLNVYWGGFPSLLSILIGFANVIYLHFIHKAKQKNIKKLKGYWVCLIIALCMLVIHFVTFDFLVNCMLSA